MTTMMTMTMSITMAKCNSCDALHEVRSPFPHPLKIKPMNIGRAIVHHIAINQTRRDDILEILKDGPKTAYKISLKMPGFCSTGTVICHLRELQAAEKTTSFGDLWELQS